MTKIKQSNPMYMVRTSVEDKERALFISKALVNSHAAVSVHINEVISTFEWKGSIDIMNEYEMTILCTDPEKVKKIISTYHTYELPEFIYVKLESSKEINKWCNDWCK